MDIISTSHDASGADALAEEDAPDARIHSRQRVVQQRHFGREIRRASQSQPRLLTACPSDQHARQDLAASAADKVHAAVVKCNKAWSSPTCTSDMACMG